MEASSFQEQKNVEKDLEFCGTSSPNTFPFPISFKSGNLPLHLFSPLIISSNINHTFLTSPCHMGILLFP